MTTKQLMRGIKRAMEQDSRKSDSGPAPAKRQKVSSQALVLRQPGQGMIERPVVPRGFTANMNSRGVIRLRNTELFQSTSVKGAATSPFAIAASTTISPRFFTWLNSVAENYSRYRFHSIKFIYRPIVGTTTNGQFAMGWFTDPVDGNFWSASVSNKLEALSQCRKFTQVPLYSSAELRLDKSDFNSDWYYKANVDHVSAADSRLINCGTIGYYVVSNPTQADAQVGNLYVEYDCELADPVSFAANP